MHQRSVHVRSSKNWKVNSVGFTAVHSVILILPETWILVSRSAWQSKKDGHVYVQAGGGIVADSIPENEYMESYNKALAVMNAVKNAKEVLE